MYVTNRTQGSLMSHAPIGVHSCNAYPIYRPSSLLFLPLKMIKYRRYRN